MRINRKVKTATVFTMALIFSNAPQVVLAEAAQLVPNQMIPTSTLIEELTKEQARENISEFLNHSEVERQLLARGLTKEEATSRLAALSKSELNLIASQIDQAKAGGDILITILVVVLIIFLIKRI
ncbi:MAG: PA2779 family protein [Bdellovibrionales bacterium]|nr:PA2779 family protein [Bdellovibrionales bacterium]